jgi:hypothetical protein
MEAFGQVLLSEVVVLVPFLSVGSFSSNGVNKALNNHPCAGAIIPADGLTACCLAVASLNAVNS